MGGLLAITLNDLAAYCTIAGLPTGEPALKLMRVIQRLDQARLNHWNEKQKVKNE